ncbi:MAG: Ivy family c-type lysozyme inhibitor [Geminicoccaceae bacterium]|uniref:Ivy family c-type lysozyme inhibitor n=1 Tax=Reyranella sp. TaxID=1929291 RepID=UPI003D0F84D8
MRKTGCPRRRHVSIAAVAALGFLLSTPRASAQSAPYLFDLLKRPAFRKSFDALFANERNVDEWIGVFQRTDNGVCGPSKRLQAGDTIYIAADVCKPHDCAANHLQVLFSDNGSKAAALLRSPRGLRWFGMPGPQDRALLEQLQ